MKKTIIATVCFVFALAGIVFSEETNAPVQNLPEWKDKTIQEMIAGLGTPTNELSYTISNAPTKGWNHGIIFSVYPKEKPESQIVTIKEYVWNQGQYEVRACCHLMKNRWLVMGAMRIDKRVRF
jgi:hypothetical protein